GGYGSCCGMQVSRPPPQPMCTKGVAVQETTLAGVPGSAGKNLSVFPSYDHRSFQPDPPPGENSEQPWKSVHWLTMNRPWTEYRPSAWRQPGSPPSLTTTSKVPFSNLKVVVATKTLSICGSTFGQTRNTSARVWVVRKTPCGNAGTCSARLAATSPHP